MSLARYVRTARVALERDPELREELRALCGLLGLADAGAPSIVSGEPKGQRFAPYAKSRGYSERYVIGQAARAEKAGTPITFGAGRGRRVDVAAADQWLRARAAEAAKTKVEAMTPANDGGADEVVQVAEARARRRRAK